MYFVDESGTFPQPAKADKNPLVVLGGVVIPESVWPKLATDLRQTKEKYHVSGEIKWRYFSPPKPGGRPNGLSHLDGEDKEALRLELLRLVVKYKSIRTIAAVVDAPAAFGRHALSSDDQLYQLTFKALSERFQYYLQDITRATGNDSTGIIVCDNRNHEQDDRLRDFHQRLIEGSGAFTSTYDRLVEGLFIAASHHSVGTQFADFVAGAVFRHYARGDRRFYDIIEPSIRRSGAGRVEGYGIVRVPHVAK